MAYNDILRLRVYGRLHGAQVVNVLHFVSQDVVGTDTPLDLANDFVTNMYTPLRNRCSSQFLFDYVEVQKIVPFEGGPVTVNFAGGANGSDVNATVSATLAEVITIYSQRGGRRGKGRLYLAGAPTMQTQFVSAGVWGSTQIGRTAALATALANRYTNILAAPRWWLGVWSRASGPKFPPWSTDQFARATSLVNRSTVRTQRRRQVGVGR